MNEMSLAVQIKQLNEMKSYLEGFCKELRQTVDEMRQQTLALKGAGLPVEKADDYLTKDLSVVDSGVEQVIKNITTQHIAFLDEVTNYLESALKR